MSFASLTAAATTSWASRSARTSARGRSPTHAVTISCSSSLFAILATFVANFGSSRSSGRRIASNSRSAIVWLDAAIDSHWPSAAW
jgi:hypothetical protein